MLVREIKTPHALLNQKRLKLLEKYFKRFNALLTLAKSQ
nr:MAG TPA: hypothetical protein [Caudoviricetes sp.]